MFPVALFSQIMHHSLPGLIRPIRNKAQTNKIVGSVLASTFVFYNMVGISIALFYGSSTNQTCSLNWYLRCDLSCDVVCLAWRCCDVLSVMCLV